MPGKKDWVHGGKKKHDYNIPIAYRLSNRGILLTSFHPTECRDVFPGLSCQLRVVGNAIVKVEGNKGFLLHIVWLRTRYLAGAGM